MPTEKDRKGFVDRVVDAVTEFSKDAVVFYDDHHRAIEVTLGVAASLAALPLTPVGSVIVGGAVAIGTQGLTKVMHDKAEVIRDERAKIVESKGDHEKSNERSQGKGLEVAQQHAVQKEESHQPLNAGRKPQVEESVKYHNHHAADALAQAGKAHANEASRAA